MRPEIKSLTGVRGVAAIWVVIYHVTKIYHFIPGGYLGNITQHGYLAVDFFFVLSGFVMALSYRRMFETGFSIKAYAIFIQRRLARIYPLYVAVTLLIVCLCVTGLSKDISLHGLPFRLATNLLLLQGWGVSESIDGPAWSISTEWAAYLVFPLLLTATKRGNFFAVSFLCGGALVWLSYLPSPWLGEPRWGALDISWTYSPWPLVRCLSEFCLGLLTHRVLGTDKAVRLASPLVGWLTFSLIVLLLFGRSNDVLVITLCPALILALSQTQNGLSALFASPIIFFLGEISYAVYLLHWELMRVIRLSHDHLFGHMGPLGADVCALGLFGLVLLLSSWATYRLLERPCRRWLRKAETFVGSGAWPSLRLSRSGGNGTKTAEPTIPP